MTGGGEMVRRIGPLAAVLTAALALCDSTGQATINGATPSSLVINQTSNKAAIDACVRTAGRKAMGR